MSRRSSSGQGLADRVHLVAAPAPRAALDLLPGRRCLRRAQPLRVLRAGGPGGGRLRNAGGGRRRGRADHSGRRRSHRATWSRRRRPGAFAGAVARVLGDPLLGERLATAAVVRARRYTWAEAASLLRTTYEELTAERLVACR